MHAHICDLRNYPNKMLASTHHPELIPEIQSDLQCHKRTDEWSADIGYAHDRDIGSRDCQAELLTTLLDAHRDAIAVERNQGLIRRFSILHVVLIIIAYHS